MSEFLNPNFYGVCAFSASDGTLMANYRHGVENWMIDFDELPFF